MPSIKLLEYDEDAQEGVVEIDISLNEPELASQIALKAFYYSQSLSEANHKISLFAFLVTNIVSENTMQAPVKTDCGYFSYHLCAKVLDVESGHVQLGNVDIILDSPIPKDISPNSYISFDVMRLDL